MKELIIILLIVTGCNEAKKETYTNIGGRYITDTSFLLNKKYNNIEISDCAISENFYFNFYKDWERSRFNNLYIHNSTFEGKFNMQHSIVIKNATIVNNTFYYKTYFDGCVFNGKANISNNTFNSEVRFNKAHFYENANMSNNSIYYKLIMDRTNFNCHYVDFRNTILDDTAKIIFYRTHMPDTIDFRGSILLGEVLFIDTIVNNKCTILKR